MDAYSPFPIEELHDALGTHHSRLPLIVLIGGLVGCIGGFAAHVLGLARSPTRSTSAASRSTAGRRSSRSRSSARFLGAGAVGGARHAGAATGCRCRTTRCSTCRASRWPRRNQFFLCIESARSAVRSRAQTRRLPRNRSTPRGDDRWRLAFQSAGRRCGAAAAALAVLACWRHRGRAAVRTCTISRNTCRCAKSPFFGDERLGSSAGRGHSRARPSSTTTSCLRRQGQGRGR